MFMFTAIKLPVSVPITTPPIAMVPEEYEAVVKRLGLTNLAAGIKEQVSTAAFEAFLAESGFRQYDFTAVKRYLDRQYGWRRGPAVRLHCSVPWGFCPLRREDRTKTGHFVADDGTYDNGRRRWRRRHNGCLLGWKERDGSIGAYDLYAKPIPLPVLMTIEKISTKFPAAQFYVSDEARRVLTAVKDPFLMVVFNGQQYIIERWDEPGFRG